MTPTLVHTPKGMIDGIQNDGYRTYYGVRYAQAPVGELRFRAPRETDPWEGVYKADRFGARCPQEPAAVYGSLRSGMCFHRFDSGE